jgi:hypothetical protein
MAVWGDFRYIRSEHASNNLTESKVCWEFWCICEQCAGHFPDVFCLRKKEKETAHHGYHHFTFGMKPVDVHLIG